MKDLDAKDPDAVNGVCPVDEQTAPDHHRQNREIDPVHPPNSERMLIFDLLRHIAPVAIGDNFEQR